MSSTRAPRAPGNAVCSADGRLLIGLVANGQAALEI